MSKMYRCLFVVILGCQLGCAPMYQREGVEIKEFYFPDGHGGVGREADGSYWIRVDGNGHATLEQVVYYWHRAAIEHCGRKQYKAEFDASIDDATNYGVIGGNFVMSRHKFPDAEGHAVCLPIGERSGKPYKSVSIEISRDGYLNDGDKYETVKKDLERTLVARIKDGVQKIDVVPHEGDLELRIVINKLSYTGSFARRNFQAMAGRAILGMEITITDSETKEILWPNDSVESAEEHYSSIWYSTDAQIKALSFKLATVLDVVL